MIDPYTYALALSVLGFVIAFHVWHTKTKKEELICILGKDCNKVIKSEHSEHFGVENTVLGMIYYAFIIIASLMAVFYPGILTLNLFTTGFLVVTGLAALFSVYLGGIQSLVIKHFCEYCLGSTAIVIAIFGVLVI